MRNGHPGRWRRGSDYAAVPRNDLDCIQRHIWRRRVVAEAKAGNHPGKAVLTAEAMLVRVGEDGTLYPSQAARHARPGIPPAKVAFPGPGRTRFVIDIAGSFRGLRGMVATVAPNAF